MRGVRVVSVEQDGAARFDLSKTSIGRRACVAVLVAVGSLGQADHSPGEDATLQRRVLPVANGSNDISLTTSQLDPSQLNQKQLILLDVLRSNAERSKETTERLAAAIEAVLKDQALRTVIRSPLGRSAEFRELRREYYRQLPSNMLDLKTIAEAAGLPESELGCRTVLSPIDKMRPGVMIVSDERHARRVDSLVAELRKETTTAILARNAGRFFLGRRLDLERTRATSIVVVKPGMLLDCGLCKARLAQTDLPSYLAALAVTRGESAIVAAFPQSFHAESSQHAGLNVDTHVSPARRAADYLTYLLAEQMLEMAFRSAYEIECKAVEVGKSTDLMGLEIDLMDRYPIGVHYFVKTSEGKDYRLFHIGLSFSDNKGHDVLPAVRYGRFNVALLEHYERRGEIKKEDLYQIALVHNIYPVEEGWLIYIDPQRLGEDCSKALSESLSSRVEQQGFLLFREVQDALNKAL